MAWSVSFVRYEYGGRWLRRDHGGPTLERSKAVVASSLFLSTVLRRGLSGRRRSSCWSLRKINRRRKGVYSVHKVFGDEYSMESRGTSLTDVAELRMERVLLGAGALPCS